MKIVIPEPAAPAPLGTLPFESGRFRCIEADPPWQYRDHGFNGFATVQKYRIHCPYETMGLADIMALGAEVQRVADPGGAHLWLWTTKDFLPFAAFVAQAWGFEYRNTFPWMKVAENGEPLMGMGHWGRNCFEYLVLATNRSSAKLLNAGRERNLIVAPRPFTIERSDPDDPESRLVRKYHSRKPEEAYDLIRRNSPGPRLAMFARREIPGFETWGNEAPPAPPNPTPELEECHG